MQKLLVAYGTMEGQTAKIANRVAEVAREMGYLVDVVNAKNRNASLVTTDVTAIVVGASLHTGHYEGYLMGWVKANRADLERLPSAFFSVSLTSSVPGPESQAQVQRCIDQFVYETGWKPRTVALFGGALAYSQYNFFKKLIMRWIAQRAGGPTDTSHDYDLTDWPAVRRFIEDFLSAQAIRS
ncbi:MAG TPA: flavodoxin domain-containing protein [Chloroflexota bacterium]|nr:flavodoxin domain-containing protein [Chloroflexota bacterium]